MNETAAENFTVLGAGIVGIACALYLQREGYAVTLVDRGAPGAGASYGNAGIFSTGSVHPVGMPGIWRKGLKMLADPLGPATIRPGYMLRIAPWLLRLMANSGPDKVEALSVSIAALSAPALDHLEPLLRDAGAADLVDRNGCLTLFESEAAFADGRRDNAYRERRGTEYEILGAEEIRQMSPALEKGFAGAIYLPNAGHTINPMRLSETLARRFEQLGGEILQREVRDIRTGETGPEALLTDAGDWPVDRLVIAAGAYSRRFAARLGSRVPLDTERGYHVNLPNAELDLNKCLLIPGRGIAVTPMENGLRIAGTVEFAGLEAAANYARAEVLLRHARELFPGIDISGADRWMGRRPSIPDSLPVISPSPKYPSAYFAFGHGHLGLTQAAITGRLIADLARGREPVIDLAPYRVDRF